MLNTMSVLKIPIWPESEGDVPMSFLHGEPGWYVWLQHRPGADLNRIERDMMLLYNNGDLKDFPNEVNPESGMYVCTLVENKIIRGLVLHKHKNLVPEEGAVIILDVDSGSVHTVPKIKIKVLPTFACKAAARAVRCDLGIDCQERFDWPFQIDEMLKRALSDAELLVTFESERPGSIPTVSVRARLWNPVGGSAIEFRDWLIRFFGPHLEIASMDGYLPEIICNSRVNEPKGEPEPSKTVESPVVPPMAPRPNFWNSYAELFLPNTMYPQVAPPPGFNPLSPFLLNQFAYLPLPWALMMPNQTDNFPTTDMCPTPFQPPVQLNSVPNEKPPSVIFNQPVLQVDTKSFVESNAAPSVSFNQPVPQLDTQSSVESSIAEAVVAEAVPRSTTPVLDVESLLDASPTLRRKMTKECLALGADAAVEPSTTQSLPSRRSPAPRPKGPEARAGSVRYLNQRKSAVASKMPKEKHTILPEVERNWPVGTVVHVIMSHVISPEILATNVIDNNAVDFDRLQNEMLSYNGSVPLSVTSKEEAHDLVGNFCVCYDVDEVVWFRAEVLDWRFGDDEAPIKAWSVDFGGFYEVSLRWIRALEGQLCTTVPIQSTLFSMHNVRPRQDVWLTNWPEEHCVEIRKLLRVDSQFWLRIEKPFQEGVWPVSVFKFSNCLPPSVNSMLVDKQLAFYRNSMPAPNQPSLNSVCDSTEWDPMKDDFDRGGQNYECDDEDACYAVSGFKPQDERNVCRFFAETGKCFKGLNCRQRHVTLREGGWTQKKEPVYTSAFNELDLPEERTVFTMQATKILNVHHFLGIRIPDKVSTKEEHLQMLLSQMNSREEVKTFEFCKTAPAFGQVVLAKDSDKGYWFRARVLDVDHDAEDRFVVQNVDTGSTIGVRLNDLREMNPAYLHLPFQAIECFLDGMVPVQKCQEFAAEGLSFITSIVKNKRLKVYVVKRTIEDALEVKVTVGCGEGRRGGEDLATVLVRKGYVKRGAQRIGVTEVCKYIPG